MKHNTKTQNLFFLISAACLMYAVSAGLRNVYGILLHAISAKTGISYSSVSFSIAVAQLVFGIAQPIFGILAMKRSNRFVLILGSLFMTVGLFSIPLCKSAKALLFFLGICFPTGSGAVSFGMIMGALTPKLGEAKASFASGLVNASSGIGSTIFSPLTQSLLNIGGLRVTLTCFSILTCFLIPFAFLISGNSGGHAAVKKERKTVLLLRDAFHDKNYLFLMIGFFTCGFHMAIIETHLYSQLLSYGIAASAVSLAFSLYGIASILGSLLSGALCTRFSMNHVVGVFYGSRVLWILFFFLLPKTLVTSILFCVLLGLTGSATVTPTSGLVGKLFGAENLPTLFGIVFLSHQTGSFFSTWLGGKCLKITGQYTLIWGVSAVLSLFAMVVSWKIKYDTETIELPLDR